MPRPRPGSTAPSAASAAPRSSPRDPLDDELVAELRARRDAMQRLRDRLMLLDVRQRLALCRVLQHGAGPRGRRAVDVRLAKGIWARVDRKQRCVTALRVPGPFKYGTSLSLAERELRRLTRKHRRAVRKRARGAPLTDDED